MILLYHESSTDATLTTPARLWNDTHEPRRYQAKGHYLELEGSGHVISYDAEEICKIPGWRLATPAEENAYAALKRKQTSLEEAAPPEAPVSSPSSDTPEEPTKAAASKSAAGKDN